jgi:2-oxoacid:acceptor oxidoreductase delta subunit (pyruvate/2-ketoisovalerate family)
MKWNIAGVENWEWHRHPLAATIPEAGNSQYYRTGSWRTFRPVIDTEKCNHCLLCWIYCPDSAVLVENEKVTGFDLNHCKGCGICVENCALKAISLVEEGQCEEA